MLEWVGTGTFKGVLQPLLLQPTGKSHCVRGITMGEISGDRVKRTSECFDFATMLRQVGVIPSTA